MSSVTGQAHGIEPAQSPARSAPLKAATTPSAARAASRLTLAMRACGYGLRTTAMYTVAGSVRLSTNVPSRAKERRILLPLDGAADVRLGRLGDGHQTLTPAADATARTMLW